MKITIENYGKTFTAEMHEDVSTYEAINTCLALLEAHGYGCSNLEGLDRELIANAAVVS